MGEGSIEDKPEVRSQKPEEKAEGRRQKAEVKINGNTAPGFVRPVAGVTLLLPLLLPSAF